MSGQDITNVGPQDPMLAFIERAAKDPAFSVEKVEAMFRLRAEEQKRIARREFEYDMSCVQAELTQVPKDRPNPAYQSRYATLEALDRIARPIYTRFGFSIRYGTAPASRDGWLHVICIISHRGGHWEELGLEAPISNEGARGGRVAMTGVQAVGSAVSYLRRYTLAMVLNLVQANDPDDDDGEATRAHRRPYSPPEGSYRHEPPPVTEPRPRPPEGNGNGDRVARFIDEWIAASEAVQTQAQGDHLLTGKLAQRADAEDGLKVTHPEQWARYDAAKQAMIARLWPEESQTHGDSDVGL